MQIGWKGLTFTRLAKADGEGETEEENASRAEPSTSSKKTQENGAFGTTGAEKGGSAKKRINGRSKGKGEVGGEGLAATRLPPPPSSGTNILPAAERVWAGREGVGADQAIETMQYDRMAITYLSLLLLPLVVGFSAKKLIMDQHAGWYSWALQSLTVSRCISALTFGICVYFCYSINLFSA